MIGWSTGGTKAPTHVTDGVDAASLGGDQTHRRLTSREGHGHNLLDTVSNAKYATRVLAGNLENEAARESLKVGDSAGDIFFLGAAVALLEVSTVNGIRRRRWCGLGQFDYSHHLGVGELLAG